MVKTLNPKCWWQLLLSRSCFSLEYVHMQFYIREMEGGQRGDLGGRSGDVGKATIAMICGTLVYYHYAFHNSFLISLISDVFIVILCSLAILGLLFRQLNISVPVDPMEWQISQDTASRIVAFLANTVGAAESVMCVAATGHNKRLFLKVVLSLYVLSVLGRSVSGVTVAYAGLCLFCLYILAESSLAISSRLSCVPSGPSRFSSADFNPAHLVSGLQKQNR